MSDIKNKTVKFFYDMVEIEVFPFKNIDKQTQVNAFAAALQQRIGRDDGLFMSVYSGRVIYTQDMRFNWVLTVPDEYKNIETWWNMIESGAPIEESYLYYTQNIPVNLSDQYGNAYVSAHSIWKPVEEKRAGQDEEKKSDPN